MPFCTCQLAHVWRRSCQRKSSIPARANAAYQALVLTWMIGLPRKLNTCVRCFPTCLVKTGWAIRKESPKLTAEIHDFFRNWAMKQGVADYRMNSYMKKVKELRDPTASAEYKRFQETLKLFEKYGKKYEFDPLMLAAQGYQESQLNQNAKSHVGAIGVMQIMPATGEEIKSATFISPNRTSTPAPNTWISS